MILIILKWLLESVNASEAEMSTFQKLGVADNKKWGSQVSSWRRAVYMSGEGNHLPEFRSRSCAIMPWIKVPLF